MTPVKQDLSNCRPSNIVCVSVVGGRRVHDVKRPKSLTDTTIREVEQEVMKNIGSDI